MARTLKCCELPSGGAAPPPGRLSTAASQVAGQLFEAPTIWEGCGRGPASFTAQFTAPTELGLARRETGKLARRRWPGTGGAKLSSPTAPLVAWQIGAPTRAGRSPVRSRQARRQMSSWPASFRRRQKRRHRGFRFRSRAFVWLGAARRRLGVAPTRAGKSELGARRGVEAPS